MSSFGCVCCLPPDIDSPYVLLNNCSSDEDTLAGADLFSEARRNVIATGMKRFEIEKFPPPQPDTEVLSDIVSCVLGQNPSPYTLNGTNVFLVGTGRKRILIDAAEKIKGNAEFVQILGEFMDRQQCDGLEMILITHMHGDHFGGCESLLDKFGDVPVGMLPCPEYQLSIYTMVNFHKRKLIPYLEMGPQPFDEQGFLRKFDDSMLPSWPDEDISWDVNGRTKGELQRDYWFMKSHFEFYTKWFKKEGRFKNARVLFDGDIIKTKGATLRVVHTPGHVENHAAFYLEEENAMFSGDTVLGYGTTVIADLSSYMTSLKRILSFKPARLYCGHGPHIADGTELLTRYIRHRQSREDQVVQYLHEHRSGVSIVKMVDDIYVNTPSTRKVLAQENIGKILLKLWRENLIVCQKNGAEFKLPSRVYMKRLDPHLTWFWSASRI